MKISDIINSVNRLVSNNSSFRLTYKNLQMYIDAAIDHINLNLRTKIHTPQEDYEQHRHFYNVIYNKNFNGHHSIDDYEGQEGEIIQNIGDCEFYMYIDGEWVPMSFDMVLELPNLDFNDKACKYEYNCLKSEIIRTVLVYYVAASYLEEEDEFESQYRMYMDRAETALTDIKQTYYSCYDLEYDKPLYTVNYEYVNPYNIFKTEEDDF